MTQMMSGMTPESLAAMSKAAGQDMSPEQVKEALPPRIAGRRRSQLLCGVERIPVPALAPGPA